MMRVPDRPRRVPASPACVPVRRRLALRAAVLALALLAAGAATPGETRAAPLPTPLPTPTPAPRKGFFLFRAPQKPVVEEGVAPTQPVAVINPSVLDLVNADNSHVMVSLGRQRAYLMVGDQVAIDSPISSGRKGHTTPSGRFQVMEKDRSHMSSIYGNYVDRNGRVVRSGISSLIDSAPAGTHYVGAPMLWFMRLTSQGVGMHVGILPGYPASHGCVRMPADIAPRFYEKVKIGTAVEIRED